ncbi:Fatty acid synthase subunit beta 1 [Phlyctema vagabunda]|uniref:Fatty acid synthase subunit beta 1 n=1 Tax=Phlyctema vagabunda TaxID=108571 RepID=A0ABR4PC14_9HELO
MAHKVIRDGREVPEPILPGLTAESSPYTFTEERGLLFSTQFTQPALTLMEIAEMEALRSKGLVQQKSIFAGHSLGEYSALAACTTFMSLESLLDLVFYRGLTMQNAMMRDEFGRTEFSMIAVNPSRIRKSFSEENFVEIAQQIASQSGLLLEIVNWNILQQQYVCAGHVLGAVCDALCDGSRSTTSTDALHELVAQKTLASSEVRRPIELQRGKTTVPLNGIDIPFHSTHLRGGVDTYRAYLKEKILEKDLVPEQLIGKFIPNVVGQLFSVDRKYVEKVAEITGSECLRKMLMC